MITNRKNSGIFDYYSILSAESIKTEINWEIANSLIYYIIQHCIVESANRSSLCNISVNSFTMQEIVALCNLPLILENSNETVTLERSDLNGDNNYINFINCNSSTANDNIDYVVREIELSEGISIPNPGYRIFTDISKSPNTNKDRLVLTLIHDYKCPKDSNILLRLCGELSETILQSYLIQKDIPISFDSPDYNFYADLDNSSLYHSTGKIVLKDYPSIKDVLFEYNYISCIIYGIYLGYSYVYEREPDYNEALTYFNTDYKDESKWSITNDELKDFLSNIDLKDEKSCIEYAIKKIHNLYFKGE